MNKIVSFLRQSTPSDILPYMDMVQILSPEGNLLFECACSTWCNRVDPNNGHPWDMSYSGGLALGIYPAKCIEHKERFGKCLIVNNGRECYSILPNHNHGMKHILTEIFVHKGETVSWRGSAGCCTIHPDYWVQFINNFELDEIVMIEIKGKP
jgi:hypothetical protein